MRRLVTTSGLLTVLVCLLASPALARDGLVLDEESQPIEGANVCLLSGELQVFCANADAKGAFSLPDAPHTGIRIQARGFQMLVLPPEIPDEPFVMERAATLKLQVVDAESGAPVETSEAFILDVDGRKRGPAPVNRHGLKLGTLKPGLIRIEVVADGYTQKSLGQAMLIKGKTADVVVKLHRDPKPETD